MTNDLTMETGYQYTCEPGTNTYYYDEDIDGNIELEAQFEACGYDDCSEDDDDDDDDDDDCAEGWRVFDCLDDGTVMHGEGCTSCEGCDLWDFTAASEGRVTCKRDGHGSYSYSYSHSYSYSYRTATYFYDEDLDGRVDEERVFESCSYQSCEGGSGDFARYEVSGGPMTFSSCENHCASLGGTVACVTSDADETALDALRAEAACGEVWVGFNDADGDGAWSWPAGCSSAREYGECDGGLCEYHRGHCVTLNMDVAECSEDHQCCACSISGQANNKNDGPDAASTSTIIASVAAAVALVLIGGLGILYLKIQRLQRQDAPLVAHVEMATVEQTAPPSYVTKGQPSAPPPGQNFCIDCGAALRGPFCGECGRRQPSALPAEETSEGTHV